MLKSISENRPFTNHSLPVAEITFNPVTKTGTKEDAIEILEDEDNDFIDP
jgi:hypothetical protein